MKNVLISLLMASSAWANNVEKIQLNEIQFNFVKFIVEVEGQKVPVYLKATAATADANVANFCGKFGLKPGYKAFTTWSTIGDREIYKGDLDTNGQIINIQNDRHNQAYHTIICQL